jgi:hypothetical protein
MFAVGDESAENWDECRPECACHYDEKKQVWHPERTDVCVILARGPKLPSEDDFASETKDAAKDKGGANDYRASAK